MMTKMMGDPPPLTQQSTHPPHNDDGKDKDDNDKDDDEDDEGEDDNDDEDSNDDEDEDEDKDDDVDDDEVKPRRTLRPHNIIITKITIRDVH